MKKLFSILLIFLLPITILSCSNQNKSYNYTLKITAVDQNYSFSQDITTTSARLFDELSKVAKLETMKGSRGLYIQGINDMVENESYKWRLKVNGENTGKDISKYIVNDTDKEIELSYEKLN